MAGTLSVDVAVVESLGAPVTVSGTGFAPDTSYVLEVSRPSGWTTSIDVTSDGSGEFSLPVTGQALGTVTVAVWPASRGDAEATTSFQVV